MKALLLVDIQNDFLPGGALAVDRGHEVIPVANRLMADYTLVVATQDWHPPEHLSFASQHPGKRIGDVIILDELEQVLWPDHCVQETWGAQLAPDLQTESISRIFPKGTQPRIDSYSGFFDNARRRATGLEQYLRQHEVQEIHIVGLATDYCVKATALDAAALGFTTVVLTAGVRGVELRPGDCKRALEQMRSAGVGIA
jgi:nicotinamidase/pyrazinamidase